MLRRYKYAQCQCQVCSASVHVFHDAAVNPHVADARAEAAEIKRLAGDRFLSERLVREYFSYRRPQAEVREENRGA